MMEDLSRHHQPVSALFARSDSTDWERYHLSEEQLESFRENGYLKGVRILSDEQVEVLRNGARPFAVITPLSRTDFSGRYIL